MPEDIPKGEKLTRQERLRNIAIKAGNYLFPEVNGGTPFEYDARQEGLVQLENFANGELDK